MTDSQNQTTAAEIVALITTRWRSKCVPSKAQPEKPASWVLSRLAFDLYPSPLAEEPFGKGVQDAALRLAASVLAADHGQTVDVVAPTEDGLDILVSRDRAARAKRSDDKAVREAAKAEVDAERERGAEIRRKAAREAANEARIQAERAEKQAADTARTARLAGRVPIYGETFAVKDRLRTECGATFDGINKRWMVLPESLAAANAIVAENTALIMAATAPVRDVLAENGVRSTGQLWEECRCGNEPVYMWSDGDTCCEACKFRQYR